MQVTLIPPEGLVPMWPKVRPLLSKTIKYTNGRYETDDILVALYNNEQQLWVAFDDEGVKGVAVTTLCAYPRMKALVVVFCAGTKMVEWVDLLQDTLRRFALDNQCGAIEANGRKGWARFMRGKGVRPLWNSVEWPLDERDE